MGADYRVSTAGFDAIGGLNRRKSSLYPKVELLHGDHFGTALGAFVLQHGGTHGAVKNRRPRENDNVFDHAVADQRLCSDHPLRTVAQRATRHLWRHLDWAGNGHVTAAGI